MLGQRASRGSAHMNGAQHGAGRDDSKGAPSAGAARAALPSVLALRTGLAAVALAGALAVLVATVTTVVAIKVAKAPGATVMAGSDSGWDRHGPALVVLALLALWLLAVGLRGAPTALAGVAVVGAVVLGIAMLSDRPDVRASGSVGEVYAEASASPGAGYYLETLGGALLLAGGGALLVLGRPARVAAAAR
jgi:hypothetical protein